MATTVQARESFLAEFERSRGELAGGAGWIGDLRRSAIGRFAEIGFPGSKNEDWKYTSVGSLLQIPFRRVARSGLSFDRAAVARAVASIPADKAATVLVFVNGHFMAELSRSGEPALSDLAGSIRPRIEAEDGGLSGTLARQLDYGVHGFAALNTAFFEDGAIVRVPRATSCINPIHLVFYAEATSEPTLAHLRNLILVEPGARAAVVEHYLGDAQHPYLTNAVTEIALGVDATLSHCKIQKEDARAFHVHRIQVFQEAGSTFASHAVAFGAALSRTEIATVLSGHGASCSLYGLYMIGGRQHVDHHTVIDHAVARTTSRELYKGILDGQARGVFTGSVKVRRDAQQVSAEQTNKNLLLGEGALVETRPQLEIHADDVRCTHGATVGHLDEDAMFYLRQRGLDQASARALLTYGFAAEVLATLQPAELRSALERDLSGLAPSQHEPIAGRKP